MSQKQAESELVDEGVEVLDLTNLKPVTPVTKQRKRGHLPEPLKLRRWIALALILLSIGVIVGMAKTNNAIPTVTNDKGSGPSKITIAMNSTHPSGGTSPPTTTQTVTLVHGKASSTSFLAQTIEFGGPIVAYVAINYDPYSVDYQTYSAYLPTGSYGVQMWQNSIPSDTRPECNVRNGMLDPFIVTGQADQVQDFVCQY